MLGNPKNLRVMLLSSVYALLTSFSPAMSADVYCPDGTGTPSVTINGTIFSVSPEWTIQSVTLDIGTSGNYFKIVIAQRFTKSDVPDRHATVLIGANNIVQLSYLYLNQSISDPRNCIRPSP
jgi:hypothetical protein